jgi:formyl-CoA transferase/CoA:oxalate CoA-transferase
MRMSLEGVRIIDLSQMLAGPYSTLIMADLGAEVIKVEPPEKGDRIRQMGPHWVDGESAYFISVNRNKKSLTLNLKDPKGREIFYKLVKKSDVVFDNFRPGTREKLGIDHETLQKHNPGIISCSISAYGKTGPYRHQPAFDLNLQAISGAMGITGEEDGAPVRMGIPMGDLGGAMLASYAIAAALYRREKTGKGENIDIGLMDAMVSLLTYVAEYYFVGDIVPGRMGSGHMSVVPYRAYKTKDIWIVIAVFTEKFWHLLCDVIGRPDLAKDPRFEDNNKRSENRAELNPILEEIFLTKNGDEWIDLLMKAEIPCAPINMLDRLFRDPQVIDREMAVDIPHPKKGTIKMLGNPVKIDGRKDVFKMSPKLGEHNHEIIVDELGLSEEEFEDLRKSGVI